MSWRVSRPALHKLQNALVLQAGSCVETVLKNEGFRGVLLNDILRYSTGSLSRSSGSLLKVRKELLSPLFPYSVRFLTSQSVPKFAQHEENKGISKQQEEDPFDSLTDKIPERPVTVAEGASYSLVILAGLAVAAAAAYAVFKELIFQPREYKIFGKALERVQHDNQVTVRLGSPITGYGQETRNRAARQRISHRTFTDEDGIERVEVMFYIRGPQGAGKVYSEMFKDKEDKAWKFTYLIVDVTSPSPTRLMLESYMPDLPGAA
ncbi:hypothetical protein BDL97_09G034200 [Sphagnum fallax]|nr:hypothetical protein BDL97_09G034200 [Sphagnum fallax]